MKLYSIYTWLTVLSHVFSREYMFDSRKWIMFTHAIVGNFIGHGIAVANNIQTCGEDNMRILATLVRGQYVYTMVSLVCGYAIFLVTYRIGEMLTEN